MSVLEEILEWSQDRPAWQRDALCHLVLGGIETLESWVFGIRQAPQLKNDGMFSR